MARRAWLIAPLALGALLLALLAQQAYWRALSFAPTGLVYTVFAALLMRLAVQLSRTAPAAAELPPAARWLPRWWRLALVLLAAALSALVLSQLAAEPKPASYTWLLLPWAAAIGATLLACAGRATQPDPTPPITLTELVALAGISGLALALRLWQLDGIPRVLGGDEAEQGLEAVRVLAGTLNNPFSTGWLGVPTLSFYLNALSIGALGQSVTALRLPWALIGSATVPLAALLVRRLHGRALGLLTGLLLALYHYHIHFSRLGSNQIADPLFIVLALLWFYRGYQTGSRTAWALCGITIGVSQYFYAGARFTGVLVLALVLFHGVRDGRAFWRSQRLNLLALLLSVLVSAAPMIQYALRFPQEYNARLSIVGVLNPEYMARETAFRQQSVAQIMLTQTERALLAYNAYPDRTWWYGSPEPLLGFWDGALFMLGLGLGALGLWDRRLLPLTLWWWGGMVLGGVLTENPPSVQRLVTTGVPTAFFVVYGAFQLLRLTVGRSGRLGAAGLALLTVLVGGLGYAGVRQYFVDYTPSQVYAGPNTQVSNALARYAQQLGPNGQIVFFGAPRMYVNTGVVNYLAPQLAKVDVGEAPAEVPGPEFIAPDRQTAFIFLPERRAELAAVAARYPGGRQSDQFSADGRELLFTIYQR